MPVLLAGISLYPNTTPRPHFDDVLLDFGVDNSKWTCTQLLQIHGHKKFNLTMKDDVRHEYWVKERHVKPSWLNRLTLQLFRSSQIFMHQRDISAMYQPCEHLTTLSCEVQSGSSAATE